MWLFLGITGFSTVVVLSTLSRYREFINYHQRTLGTDEAQLPWDSDPMTVDSCVDWVLDWGLACEGLNTMCSSHGHRLLRACLESGDRVAYCTDAGPAVDATRFGYHDCEKRRASLAGRYEKRSSKKVCAGLYRDIADYCKATETL